MKLKKQQNGGVTSSDYVYTGGISDCYGLNDTRTGQSDLTAGVYKSVSKYYHEMLTGTFEPIDTYDCIDTGPDDQPIMLVLMNANDRLSDCTANIGAIYVRVKRHDNYMRIGTLITQGDQCMTQINSKEFNLSASDTKKLPFIAPQHTVVYMGTEDAVSKFPELFL